MKVYMPSKETGNLLKFIAHWVNIIEVSWFPSRPELCAGLYEVQLVGYSSGPKFGYREQDTHAVT